MQIDATTPSVSVIIPVYNGEKYLAEALESVFAQTFTDYEIIVIDDGSTDQTPVVLAHYAGIRILAQENKGTAAARNLGVATAKGTYIGFLDADDLWLPEKLELQVAALQADQSIDIVTGHVQQFYENSVPSQAKKDPQPGVSPIAMLMRRVVFDKLGPFHEHRNVAEFISWYAAADRVGICLHSLSETVARRRIHSENLSIRHKRQKNATMLQILKSKLDHQRNDSH